MSDELQNDHAERIRDYLAGAPVPLDHDDVARLLGEHDALRGTLTDAREAHDMTLRREKRIRAERDALRAEVGRLKHVSMATFDGLNEKRLKAETERDALRAACVQLARDLEFQERVSRLDRRLVDTVLRLCSCCQCGYCVDCVTRSVSSCGCRR